MTEDWGTEVKVNEMLGGNMLEIYDPDVDDEPMAVVPEDASMEIASKLLEYNIKEVGGDIGEGVELGDMDRPTKLVMLTIFSRLLGLGDVGNRLMAESISSSGILDIVDVLEGSDGE